MERCYLEILRARLRVRSVDAPDPKVVAVPTEALLETTANAAVVMVCASALACAKCVLRNTADKDFVALKQR